MYVVTFYSFKGGVGRTMALANVALSLAQAGRKVLLVDFDLEAPGIETFDLLRPKEPSKGIVDFVTTYVNENATPDVKGYVYECTGIPDMKGKAWVMPAGLRDAGYGQRLATIDWQKLYDEHDGYLMVEDLKAQWEEAFQPDYVFIDSRTGHTDVGGICTRQLPDAVVILFFPNEQNLRGLQKVVSDIRAEEESPRRKHIELHFATSNVPDLDDEERILAAQFDTFRETLGYAELSATIHHYPSLALLRQDVFSLTHPRSRLASEYKKLKGEILSRNLGDREGAINYLFGTLLFMAPLELFALQEKTPPWMVEGVDARLRRIEALHISDPTVLMPIAMVRSRRDENTETLRLLEMAERAGSTKTELHLLRAQTAEKLGGAEYDPLIIKSVEHILASPAVSLPEFMLAVNLLRRYRGTGLSRIHRTPAFCSLSRVEQFGVLERFMTESWRPALSGVTTAILETLGDLASATIDELHALSLALIAIGRFGVAVEVLENLEGRDQEGHLRVSFNLAMARWGDLRRHDPDRFEVVVELDRTRASQEVLPPDANYHQCIAIALWACGDTDGALERVATAIHQAGDRRRDLSQPLLFSAWRYLNVSNAVFLRDISDLERQIRSGVVHPLFVRKARPLRRRKTTPRGRRERRP